MRPADLAVQAVTRHQWSAREAIASLAALIRFSALGGTLILPLTGAASGPAEPTVATAAAALLIGLGFHVFAYVLNDVVDLPIDRTDPGRAAKPLVRGAISPGVGLVLAVGMLAIAILAALATSPWAAAGVAAASIGLGTYDVLGKRTRWPPLSDVVQGLGWGALVVSGACLVGGTSPLTAAIAAYVATFIVMANGVHGALRDLENDALHGVPTTAALLGARVESDGRRVVSGQLLVFTWVLQAVLVAIAVVAVLAGGSPIAAVPIAASVVLLVAASQTGLDNDRNAAGMLHLVAGLLVPVALVVGTAPPWWLLLTVAAFVVPLLTHGWLPGALVYGGRAIERAGRSAGDLIRVARPHNCVAAGAAVVVGAHVGGRENLIDLAVVQAALVAALVVGAGNVANDRADVAEDRINRPGRPIPAGRVSMVAAGRFGLLLAASAILLAIGLGWAAAAATAVLSLIAAAYSGYVPGVPALKGVPVAGNATVAVLSSTTIVFGALVLAVPTPAVAVAAIAIFISVLSSEVLKTTADRDGDRAAGRATLATARGVPACLRIHAGLVSVLVAIVVLAPLTGAAAPAFLLAGLAGVVAPQLWIVARLRGTTSAAAIRPVLPLTKVAWFTGLASLVFLV